MKNIKDFIDANWYTVPLKGKLERLADGKKTLPTFPENWKDTYSTKFNKKVTELGGVITGYKSNIIAIDCDSDASYKIFKALDPDYEAVMLSRGKTDKEGNPVNAATIIYEYVDELEESFSLPYGNVMAMDFYSTKGFIYLPTDKNTSKVPWTKIPELKKPPKEVIALLRSLKPVRIKEEVLPDKKRLLNLNPQITNLVKDKKVEKALFKILTPKDFRDCPEYINRGFLHPNEVPDGRGSEYLSKVSAVLGADCSIDEELYNDAIITINNFFDQPMQNSRLASTIIEPMIEERSSINGTPIWQYDENWQDGLVTITTKLNTTFDLFYDMHRRIFYAVNVLDEVVQEFQKDSDLFSFLEAIAKEAPGRKETKSAMPLVSVMSTPKMDFGFFGDNREHFNTFRSSIPLSIFKNPQSYKDNYAPPTHILEYFRYLIPDDYMRNYLFKFLRRKFDLFEYSPVVLYLLGVSGSGKDLFVSIIEEIMGTNNVAKPLAREFVEKHNGWMVDKYFAQLDEYGDQLHRTEDKDMAKGLIKAYSGKKTVQIRQMRTDGFQYTHNVTFIATANTNPITFDADDRRIALFPTPNVLRFQPLAEELGLEEFVNRILNEINDFAYWLATSIENATLEDYQLPPETHDKKKLIATKLNAGSSIAYHLENHLFTELAELAETCGVSELFLEAGENRITEDKLFELYDEMTNGNGTKRGLTIAMKSFDKVPSTRKGKKAYYYKIPGLQKAMGNYMTPVEVNDTSTLNLELKHD